MKRINITLASLLAMSSGLYAGGVFTEPVYVTEDIVHAEEVIIETMPEYVAPVEEEVYVAPVEEEVYVAPVEEEVYVAPPVEEEVYVAPPVEETVCINPPVEEEVYVAPPVVEEYVAPIKQEVYVAPPPPPVAVKNIRANGLYVGVGLSAARFDPSCNCPTKSNVSKTAGIVGRIGYDINKYIGLEARGIRTNWNVNNGEVNGGRIKHYGAFVKPMIPISEQTNIYGLVGYAKTETEGRLQKVDAKTLAWGVGMEYDVSQDKAKNGRYSREFDGKGDQEKGLGVFADYERLIQKSGSPDLDSVNVGLTYDF